MIVMDGGQPATATATDLGNFASREWMQAAVVDYPGHFATLKNAQWFRDAQAKEEAGEDVSYIDPDNSEMSDWSGDVESLTSAENAENLQALVEFLVSEAGHGNVDVNQDLLEKGKAVAIDGAWAGSLEGTNCADCHSTLGEDFAVLPDDEVDGYPSLAKYGSAAWLSDFIRHPGAARHYGEKNRMPSYSPTQITDEELSLLVRWMTGDYLPTEVEDYPAVGATAAVSQESDASEQAASEPEGDEPASEEQADEAAEE
jgi:ubiquinol-cytochrome c reductase cytochrome b subunit